MVSVHGAKGEKMRLIDAEALIQDIKDHKIPFNADINEAIVCAPTIDAVEVVRCKDCFYSWPFDEEELKEPYRVGEWHCEFWYGEMHEDDYCSCGKRRPNEKA